MIDNKKLKTTLTTNFQLPKQVNQAKEEAFAKIKASKVSEATETEVSSTISSASETDFTSKPVFTSETDFIPKPDFAHKTSKSSYKQNFYKGFAAIAASAAIFSIVCTANPALADNIPVVGSVFQTLGKSLGFYGDFKHLRNHSTPVVPQMQILPLIPILQLLLAKITPHLILFTARHKMGQP